MRKDGNRTAKSRDLVKDLASAANRAEVCLGPSQDQIKR
jgi:hypothetical protein